MKQNKGRNEEVQKGTKNAIKKEKNEKHCRKKEEKSMKARKEEETRKGMRRLDPEPMSVSVRPQNKQLSMKDETKGGKPRGAKYFLREKHEVFPTKIAQKENISLNKTMECTSVFFF